MTKSRKLAVFHVKEQEGGSFSQHKEGRWKFFMTKSRRLAVFTTKSSFHNKKQDGGSFFEAKKLEGGSL